MNFQGHALGGAAAAVGTMAIFVFLRDLSAQECFALGVVTFVGALAPDMDIGSVPARWFGRIGLVFAALCFGLGHYLERSDFLTYGSLPGMLALALMGMKHRGPTHKHWLPVFLLCLAFFGSFSDPLAPALMIGFAAGMETHLALDMIFPWSLKGWIL